MDKMTNEEAIAIIRKEYLCVNRDCDIERSCGKCDLAMPSKEPILQAYKLAIKALEQEPCDDAISRQAVLDKEVYTETNDGWTGWTVDVNDIKALPSVTPAEKVGHWEWEPFNKYWGEWRCSKCRELITACETDWAEINKPIYKYCHNCGAKMEGES